MKTLEEEPPLPSDPQFSSPTVSALKLVKSENSQELSPLDTKNSKDLKSEAASKEEVIEKEHRWKSLHSFIWHDESRAQETAEMLIRKLPGLRSSWSSKVEYLMAYVGFSVGLANIWSFPQVCLHYGRGIFLLSYILLIFLVGVPLLFLEMGIGQRMGLGSIGAWKNISPWIGGLGYSNFIVCCIVGSYYSVRIAWCVYYLLQSFHFPLPWTLCPILKNSSDPDPECTRTLPTTFFWYRHVLKASDQMEIGGLPDDHLTLCLFLTWFIIGLSLMNGLKSTSKMLYVSVLLPYIFLFGFLLRNFPLEGGGFGITSLLEAKVSVLYSLEMWRQTAKQMLFSLGPGFGSYVAISSYAPRSNNCIVDAFVVAIFNLVFSIVATVIVFSLLGHLATQNIKKCYQKNINIVVNLINNGVLPANVELPNNAENDFVAAYLEWFDSLSEQVKRLAGPHMTDCDLNKQLKEIVDNSQVFLITVTTVICGFSKPSIIAIIIYVLLVNLGLSTLIGIVQGIVTPIQDTLPISWKQRKWLSVSICVFMFLGSIIFMTPSGSYILYLLDEHWLSLPFFGITILESVAIAWLYGARRFLADMTIIMNHPVWPIYRWLWSYVIPILLLILIFQMLSQMYVENITYLAWNSSTSQEVSLEYPLWAKQFCASMIIFTFFPIPAYFLYHRFRVICSNRKAQMTNIVTNAERRGWRNSIVGRAFALHTTDRDSTPGVSCSSSITTRSDYAGPGRE